MKNWNNPKWNASRKIGRGPEDRFCVPAARQTAKASMDMLKAIRRISRKLILTHVGTGPHGKEASK
jgi:hypothetical protein